MDRLSKHQYFMDLAFATAKRATCNRLQVGAVAVNQRSIVIATGYNGAPCGMPHCIEIGCEMENGHCIACVHAEINAVIQAGTDLVGGTVYCTYAPCLYCLQVMINAGVQIIYFDSFWKPPTIFWYKTIEIVGINVKQFSTRGILVKND